MKTQIIKTLVIGLALVTLSLVHAYDLPSEFADYQLVKFEEGGALYVQAELEYQHLPKTGDVEFISFFIGRLPVAIGFDPGDSDDPAFEIVVGESSLSPGPSNWNSRVAT